MKNLRIAKDTKIGKQQQKNNPLRLQGQETMLKMF